MSIQLSISTAKAIKAMANQEAIAYVSALLLKAGLKPGSARAQAKVLVEHTLYNRTGLRMSVNDMK